MEERKGFIKQSKVSNKQRTNKQAGFTLIELIVVIAILSVLIVMMVPSMLGYVKEAKKSTCQADARVIATASQLANLVVESPCKDGSLVATMKDDSVDWSGSKVGVGDAAILETAIQESVQIKRDCTIEFDALGQVTKVEVWEGKKGENNKDNKDNISGTWTR